MRKENNPNNKCKTRLYTVYTQPSLVLLPLRAPILLLLLFELKAEILRDFRPVILFRQITFHYNETFYHRTKNFISNSLNNLSTGCALTQT